MFSSSEPAEEPSSMLILSQTPVWAMPASTKMFSNSMVGFVYISFIVLVSCCFSVGRVGSANNSDLTCHQSFNINFVTPAPAGFSRRGRHNYLNPKLFF